MKKHKAVIFDLDGTLLDSVEDIGISMNMVLKAKGFPEHPIKNYNQLVGSGAGTLVSQSIPSNLTTDDALLADCLAQFRTIYRENWNIHSKLYDGITDLLDSLTEQQTPFAIFSNKPNNFVQLCVNEHMPNYKFTHVLGHSDNISLKPDPTGALIIADGMGIKPNDIIFVGDTGIDMQTATNANMLPIGVPWGFRPEELLTSGAESVISHPTDLLDFLTNGTRS